MNNNKDIEKRFRSGFEDYSPSPSKGLWSGISRKLSMRRFFKFDPRHINVYYASAMFVMGGLGLSLFLGEKDALKTDQNEYREEILQEKESGKKAPIFFSDSGEMGENKDASGSNGESSAYGEQNLPVSEESLSVQKNTKDDKEPESESLLKKKDVKETDSVSVLSPVIQAKESLLPLADYQLSTQKGCVPLSVSFSSHSKNAEYFEWHFGDGGVSFDRNTSYIYDEPGTYPVSLRTWNESGEDMITKDTIYVYSRPVAVFEISPSSPDIPDETVFFYNYSKNASGFVWDFGDGSRSTEMEPFHKYSVSGSYDILLIALSEGGCADSSLVTDAFGTEDCYLSFPNAFVPNSGGPTDGFYSTSDQSNSVFHPVYKGIEDYHLKIFNRNGVLIFESDRIDIGWDGYLNGSLARQDVYIWKVRGRYSNGESYLKHGNLTLIWSRQ